MGHSSSDRTCRRGSAAPHTSALLWRILWRMLGTLGIIGDLSCRVLGVVSVFFIYSRAPSFLFLLFSSYASVNKVLSSDGDDDTKSR